LIQSDEVIQPDFPISNFLLAGSCCLINSDANQKSHPLYHSFLIHQFQGMETTSCHTGSLITDDKE